MTTSLASQLQALKSVLKADGEPLKRPFTRPSILYDPKDAADLNKEEIFNIGLSGLEALIDLEGRFRDFKNDLFSDKSIDRELMGIVENDKINASIRSYLRLLSAYFKKPAALMTVEYLIRSYKIHVYNMEELVLCTLPYHDTPEFVRVVQLIDTGNSRWKFLDGVKTSGAPLSRKVIVQQCVRDPGVLEVFCNYATPSRKIQPSKPVVAFCTAVVIELLGCNTTIDNDIVKRIIPYVLSGLQAGSIEKLEQKAGTLMIVGLLAQRVALSLSLVKSLLHAVAEVAREDAKKSTDFQWFRMLVIAFINLVQFQHLKAIPKKIIDILTELRDISKILCGLITEFNIDMFLAIFMDSLLEYSSSDKNCHQMLMAMIETVPLKDYVDSLVSKLLKICQRPSKSRDNFTAVEVGDQAKQILESFHRKYPVELREAVLKFLQCEKWGLGHEYGSLDFSTGIPYSKIWFALQHPKAQVRRSALTGLDNGLLCDNDTDSKGLNIVQDAFLRQLEDDDLRVVKAALTVKGLNELINPQVLCDALQNVLKRCIRILMGTLATAKSLASDVGVACLEFLITSFKDQEKYARTLATTIFPFALVISKAQKIYLKALELSKEVKWPSYQNLMSLSEMDKELPDEQSKLIISVNSNNISELAKDFLARPKELIPWLVECCDTFELSKTLFFLILLEAFMMPIKDGQFFELFDDFLRILRSHWESLESTGNIIVPDETRIKLLLDWDCKKFLEHLDTSSDKLNSEIMICLFHRLLEALVKAVPENDGGLWLSKLEKLFLFFASQLGHDFLVLNCKLFSPKFLVEMFTKEGVSARVQAESLCAFSHLCSQSKDMMDGNQASVSDLSSRSDIQLLHEFPSVLIPLASDDRDVRTAAMSCIEGMFALWSCQSLSSWKNGTSGFSIHFLGELLGLLVQQKRLILSDGNFLQSLFESLLNSTSDSLLMQETLGKRFDQLTKEEILNFLLVSPSLSFYGKLKILSLLKGLGSKILEINAIKLLLFNLLKRHHRFGKSSQKLSTLEVNILCLLLESCIITTAAFEGNNDDDLILKTLVLNGMSSEDGVILKPCLTLLRNLSTLFGGLKIETQERIFHHLLILSRNGNSCIQNAAREALLQIDVSCSVVTRVLDSVLDHSNFQTATSVKKIRTIRPHGSELDVFQRMEITLSYVSSLLDVLLLKKNMKNRSSLLTALFKLGKFLLDGAVVKKTEDGAEHYSQASAGLPQTTSCHEIYIQQELLVVLEDICSSLISDALQECVTIDQFDLEFLVKCAHSSKNVVTRNHVFSLFCTLSKVIPDKVLDHILDILIIAGESAITQLDGHSCHAFEDLVSAVVPFWLSKTGDMEKMMQIFVDILPQVAQSQRLSIVVHLLRNLGESSSFSLMIFLLFRALVLRNNLFCTVEKDISLNPLALINGQWEYLFAKQLSEHYSCTIWLPSIVSLLQKIGGSTLNEELFMQLIVSIQFVLEKLLDPEIAFKIDIGEDVVMIQATTGDLLEQVIFLLQLLELNTKHVAVSLAVRKKLKEDMHFVLNTIARGLSASTYFKVIIKLLRHADKNAGKKALGLLCETVKETRTISKHHERKGVRKSFQNSWFHFDKMTQKSFNDMCLEILKLVDSSGDGPAGVQLKLAAISTLQIVAKSFPTDYSISSKCLYTVSRNICSKNPAVSSACLHATGALIDVLQARALSELPVIMKGIFLCVKEETRKLDGDTSSSYIKLKDSILTSVLVSLEAVVDKLGFLNPYLSDILELLVLHPSVLEFKLKAKVDIVRKLITDKIPVRLLLPPLLRMYTEAVSSGESSLSITFEMLGNIVGSMDKSSVAAFHLQIFDLCMLALDLRSQCPASVKHTYVVEEKVTNCVVILTSKLTETMFKPLLHKSIEWSRSCRKESEPCGSKVSGRAISFYGLVNQLAETLRSLFVPYFEDLYDGCVAHLTDVEDTLVGLTQKKKKVKLQAGSTERRPVSRTLTLEAWHLRTLILSYLHKCFLYATGNLEFLETKDFKVIVKAVVWQLVMDPPSLVDQHPELPSIKEVDDLLFACIGQMALTGRSDLPWELLNDELLKVLDHARNGGVRGRILGLRIVKHQVENLKEEYVAVALPKTIRVLSELLEDVELPVKTLAQEILKEMESLTDENLQDYL